MPKNKVELPPDVAEFFRSQGSRGGKRSLETMTPEERTARAKSAVAAREANRAAGKQATKTEAKKRAR